MSIQLRKFRLNDYEELVDMYYEFTKEVYQDRKIGPKYFFHKKVSEWINESKDIVMATKDNKVVGFTLAFVDDTSGITEPIYFGEIAFVRPDYRKTRAGYLLYKNVSNYATELNMTLVANGLATNGVSNMIKKHFDCKEMFINFERKI